VLVEAHPQQMTLVFFIRLSTIWVLGFVAIFEEQGKPIDPIEHYVSPRIWNFAFGEQEGRSRREPVK
jgi:hypothetical protein